MDNNFLNKTIKEVIEEMIDKNLNPINSDTNDDPNEIGSNATSDRHADATSSPVDPLAPFASGVGNVIISEKKKNKVVKLTENDLMEIIQAELDKRK